MSRGPGRIERAIAAILDTEPDNAFTTEDLCDRIYSGINRTEKKHRVAVLRAAANLMKRRDTVDCFRWSASCAYYNRLSVLAYAMARLKADPMEHYRSKDVYRWNSTSEADLQATLAETGNNHRLIVPGGAWWRHTQHAVAELEATRAGDTERLERVRAEAKAENEAALAGCVEGIHSALKGPVQCSFCDKNQEQVTTLFTGCGGAAICNECVDRCVGLMNAPKTAEAAE